MNHPNSRELFRPLLTGHCYRMLGSVLDAEDAVQESMLRAWKSLDRFDERSSMKTWLCRITTNVCLDPLSSSKRQRIRPVESTHAPETVRDGMTLPQRDREHWVEPIPDVLALPVDATPTPRNAQSFAKAFVSHSSPRSSICRRASARCCCSRRCSTGRPRKPPRAWT